MKTFFEILYLLKIKNYFLFEEYFLKLLVQFFCYFMKYLVNYAEKITAVNSLIKKIINKKIPLKKIRVKENNL